MSLEALYITLVLVSTIAALGAAGLSYAIHRPKRPPTPAELWEANDNPLWR